MRSREKTSEEKRRKEENGKGREGIAMDTTNVGLSCYGMKETVGGWVF